MASPLYSGMKKLLLVVATTLILQQSTATDGNYRLLAKHGCPDKCGNVSIPYPFGIGKGCFREGFEVNCSSDNVAILNTSGTPLLEINLTIGEARIQNYISEACNIAELNRFSGTTLPVRRFFMVSRTKNIFTTVGCSAIGLIAGDIETPIEKDGVDENDFYGVSACGSFCGEDSILNDTDCSGRGCCQSAIPRNLKSFYPYFVNYSLIRAKSFGSCSYAFVSEVGSFKFDPSYVKTQNLKNLYGFGPPLVLEWVVGNASCEAATKTGSSACVDTNSECIDVPSGRGYRCNCSAGYEGNPYLARGCQDINECDSPLLYPCHGKCKNTKGGYMCSCPPGTQSKDPKNAACTPNNKMIIALAISLVFLIVCIFFVITMCEKNKLAKERDRFFKQNGGHILYQQILSKQVDTITIFTAEDLKKATDNFDKSRELGIGGHGIVYKGIMRDNKVVAVKRSKIIDVIQTDEFVQEIIILSQINHRNVVRLLGCCLEVEVPILVYEFIPNGTLFHLIHGDHDGQPLSLEIRLKIAQESAEALAYLHLSTNHSIVHGDVKSMNILLDENYMAKVTDFGASRILPKDSVQLMTMVQGTLGYLDPEYLQERKLTEKSDVYSFGVVLLELITRKRAVYFEGPNEEGKNLASSFVQAMKENRVESMLDANIMDTGLKELFQEVAELASKCLSLKREERPSMTQVADKLKAVRSTWREILLLKHEETHRQIERLGMDPVVDLSPSMSYTAQMLGLDIETATAYRTGITSTG
ncbi:unnamed protein product [Urochloa humidicola]